MLTAVFTDSAIGEKSVDLRSSCGSGRLSP